MRLDQDPKLSKKDTMVQCEELDSKEWKAKRLEALERAANRCVICNRKQRLRVHHRAYNKIKHLDVRDLTVLCGRCYERQVESRIERRSSTRRSQARARGKADEWSDLSLEDAFLRVVAERSRRKGMAPTVVLAQKLMSQETWPPAMTRNGWSAVRAYARKCGYWSKSERAALSSLWDTANRRIQRARL